MNAPLNEISDRPSTAEMKHGAFWQTKAAQKLLENLPDQDSSDLTGGSPIRRPKQKGDVVSLIDQPIPQSRLATPWVDHEVQQNMAGRKSIETRSGSHELDLEEHDFPEDEQSRAFAKIKYDANGVGATYAAEPLNPNEIEFHKNMHKMDTTTLSQLTSGGGRNAHRALMHVKRDEGERLRAGERPRDKDILGQPRETPIRIEKGKRGELVSDPSFLPEKSMISFSSLSSLASMSASHMKTPEDASPQASIISKKGGGRNIRSDVVHTFEVLPHILDMGTMELRQKYSRQLILTNISESPARFRVSAAVAGAGLDTNSIATLGSSSQMQMRETAGIVKKDLDNKVKVIGRPKQPVAPGMKVPIDLEISAGALGRYSAIIEIISEFEIITIEVFGKVSDSSNTEPP